MYYILNKNKHATKTKFNYVNSILRSLIQKCLLNFYLRKRNLTGILKALEIYYPCILWNLGILGSCVRRFIFCKPVGTKPVLRCLII